MANVRNVIKHQIAKHVIVQIQLLVSLASLIHSYLMEYVWYVHHHVLHVRKLILHSVLVVRKDCYWVKDNVWHLSVLSFVSSVKVLVFVCNVRMGMCQWVVYVLHVCWDVHNVQYKLQVYVYNVYKVPI